jgi:hypothetical protein
VSGKELGSVSGLEKSSSTLASEAMDASPVVVRTKLIVERGLQIPLVIPPVVGTHEPTCGFRVDSPSIVGAKLVLDKALDSFGGLSGSRNPLV